MVGKAWPWELAHIWTHQKAANGKKQLSGSLILYPLFIQQRTSVYGMVLLTYGDGGLETPSQRYPGLYLLGDSKCSQVDNEDKPSHSANEF